MGAVARRSEIAGARIVDEIEILDVPVSIINR